MIKIMGNYFCELDESQITLKKRVIPKNEGEPYFEIIGYYNSWVPFFRKVRFLIIANKEKKSGLHRLEDLEEAILQSNAEMLEMSENFAKIKYAPRPQSLVTKRKK